MTTLGRKGGGGVSVKYIFTINMVHFWGAKMIPMLSAVKEKLNMK